jgi:hypothetical protein
MRRTLLIYEQTVEREGEEVWARWEEVGSRGLDSWTELPAVCTPYQTAQTHNPAEAPPVLGKEKEGARAAVPVLSVSPRSRFVLEAEGR